MRRILTILILLLAAQGVGGFLFAWSGLYSVAASQHHWPVTRWFLEMAMSNSIETHAMLVGDPPDLDDMALVQQGAGHYEDGCAPCHGAPAAPRNPISRHMLPAPPYLPDQVANWTDRELYWITLNGIKMAGMPAWPAQARTEEPWALAAFLRRLDGMDGAEYRRLAFGEADPASDSADLAALSGPAADALRTCARCHGYDGNGRSTGAFPRLAGQSAAYLYESLQAYASGARPSGFMQPPAASLTDEEMKSLADYYASRKADRPRRENGDPTLVAVGRTLAAAGDAARGVAPCASCHGPGAVKDARYPRLAGQHAGYLAEQLRLWRRGVRGETPLSRIMGTSAHDLTDEQIRAVSHYYASVDPTEPPRTLNE